MPTDTFEYDVAISFAGEQRSEAEAIARCLQKSGARVFYDGYEQADLWGKNLYEHLDDVYQNKARYCLLLISSAYAEKVWTNHERRSAQARALLQKTEYILPVRFDGTEIPGLPPTVGYLRFQDRGVAGICVLLLQKLGEPSETLTATGSAETFFLDDLLEQRKFVEQLKTLPDTTVMKRIWSKPRWRIWIRPTEFKKARFQDLEACRDFVRFNAVRGGAFPYPPSSANLVATGDEWIAYELDASGVEISRMDRWCLFRSGQFVDNRAFDEIVRLGGRIHVFEILDTITGAFEFAAKMTDAGLFSPRVAITLDLHGVDGRQLTWPRDQLGYRDAIPPRCWCQDDHIAVEKLLLPQELKARSRKLAVEVATVIFSKFGWSDPPTTHIAEAQTQRFN